MTRGTSLAKKGNDEIPNRRQQTERNSALFTDINPRSPWLCTWPLAAACPLKRAVGNIRTKSGSGQGEFILIQFVHRPIFTLYRHLV